ncbi:MAG: phosphoglycerate mutase family protein [Polyangiales bacterium]
MRVVCVRHGEAVSPDDATDAHRWLTDAGRAAVRELGARLLAAGHVASVIYTSPLVRAVQTAELLAAATGFAGAVGARPALALGTASQVVDMVDSNLMTDTVMLVGHEPSIRAFAAHFSGEARLGAFAPATAVIAEWDAETHQGRFVARLDPGLG